MVDDVSYCANESKRDYFRIVFNYTLFESLGRKRTRALKTRVKNTPNEIAFGLIFLGELSSIHWQCTREFFAKKITTFIGG